MRLKDLEAYPNITIQCHDNPDADTIASGFGLFLYFQSKGVRARLIYGGRFKIRKSNLLSMISMLKIPIEYTQDYTASGDELLLSVDCQYGAGNVTVFPAAHVAVIDHHQREIDELPLSRIESQYGSCSTLVWKLLLEEAFPVNENRDLCTALYYGLFMDTGQFSEIEHPLDRDMRDSLPYDQTVFHTLKNANLSLSELEIAGIALIRSIYNDTHRFAIVKAKPCDPNILGLISDICIQVDSIDTCIVYNELADGVKLSVRSCIPEVRASELASYLTGGMGSGGGHPEKAGGFIRRRAYDSAYSGIHLEAYFSERMNQYFNSYDVIRADACTLPAEGMSRYIKRSLPMGYARARDILPPGTPVTIRTLEGDEDTVITGDMYIMIGTEGNVYPCAGEIFESGYRATGGNYSLSTPYPPIIKDRLTGAALPLFHYTKACIPSKNIHIYAKPLEKALKVFGIHGDSNGGYMLGLPGDYVAVRSDDPHDIYIIKRDLFPKIYEPCAD